MEVTEEHEILSATQYYFRAGKSRQILSRRTASVGPGLLYDYDHEHEEIDDESITHEGLQQTSQESSNRGSKALPSKISQIMRIHLTLSGNSGDLQLGWPGLA